MDQVLNGKAALKRATDIVGGQSALARVLGDNVKQGHIWYWLKKAKVPAEYCAAIERATKGEVSRHDLRPDLFDRMET